MYCNNLIAFVLHAAAFKQSEKHANRLGGLLEQDFALRHSCRRPPS